MDNLGAAARGLKRLRESVRALPSPARQGIAAVEEKFIEIINDDLDTPKALALAWDLLKSKRYDAAKKKSTLLRFDLIFGLDMDKETHATPVPNDVRILIKEREEARTTKDWTRADQLRRAIKDKGYEVEDTPSGPEIKQARSGINPVRNSRGVLESPRELS
jgi:cysteinyl-tRNA synthetase